MVTGTDARCFFCRTLVGDGPDLTPSMLYSFDGHLEEVCESCIGHADIETSPDYTEDED